MKAFYQNEVIMFKALANANRLAILGTIIKEPKTVTSIAEEVDLSVTTVSNHLNRMRRDKIVKAEQKGLYVHYEIRNKTVKSLLPKIHSDRLL